jgi:hypothetical protein
MRSELYEALRAATEGEFQLLGELDCDAGWIAYLAASRADGALALLLLHRTPEGHEFDLQVAHALDGSLAVGKTTCPACGAVADGWPRFCAGCRRDLSGVAPDAAETGSAPGELLQAVRDASEGVYEVLGAMHHAEGGGALYFAREDGGRIVGLVLEREADGGLSLAQSWAYDHDALAATPPAAAPVETPFAAARVEEPTLPAPPYAPATPAPPGEPAPAAPALLLYDEPAPASRRPGGPSRRVLYGAAGALLIAAGVVLALVVVQRSAPSADAAVARPAAPAPVAGSPAPAPVQPVTAFTDSVVAPAATPAEPRPARRTRPRPAPAQPAPAAPAEPARPSAEEDRRAVLGAVARYANAVESRQMDRIRAAYPGISGEEMERWTAWFSRFTPNVGLGVTHSVTDGPEIQGDVATLVVTLTMRYQGQRHQVTSRATLRRGGDGWVVQELRALQ